ncbi:MAG: response regulator [Flavitalea sp.]
MPNSFKRNIVIGFGLSLSLLIISSAASYISIQKLLFNAKWVDHTHKALLDLDDINTSLISAETHQRGYLLTSDSAFMKSFSNIGAIVKEKLIDLKTLTGDNAFQQKNIASLKDLANRRLNYLSRGINAKKEGRPLTVAALLRGKQTMDSTQAIIKNMQGQEQLLLLSRTEKLQKFSSYTPILIIAAALLSLLITGFFYLRIISDFKKRWKLQQELQQKDASINRRIKIIQDIADKISAGNYKIRVDDEGKDVLGSLSFSLNKMAQSLDYSFTLLSDKEWLQESIADLNQQMLGEKDLQLLSSSILNFVVNRTGSKVGALYLIDDSGNLELSGAYALSPEVPRKMQMGEGLPGQSALTRKEIVVSGIIEDSFSINSASGKLKPRSIIVFPLIHDGVIKGVVELGAMHELTALERSFIGAVSDQTAIVIDSAERRRKLQELLEETQSQAEELQLQHSELEHTNESLKLQSQKLQVSEEELKVQQEELMQTNQELEERTKMLEEKNQMIEERNHEIQMKARELAASARYKSEFLANMSHELRTPLNSILLLSRMMSENNEQNLSVDQVEYARVIQSSGYGLLSLIDEILDLAKIESGKMEMDYAQVAVQEIVEDIQSLFNPVAKDKKLDFIVEVSPDVAPHMETDKLRLEQVIKNLLSNALKFTSKGSVGLVISRHPSDPSLIRFSVKDTGIGIHPEKQKLIFEAFQQADGSTRRQYGGTGLGLSISRELTKLLGGQIQLISEPGKGSEFTLFIPVSRPVYMERNDGMDHDGTSFDDMSVLEMPVTVTEKETPPEIKMPAAFIADDREQLVARDKTILIIEDDIHFAKTLLDFSRKNGYKGIVTNRGEEGVELAKLFRPIGILLDIKLPGKDGWEVMRELKQNLKTKHIPIHIMSSYEVKKKSISSGAVDFINKPLALEKMHEVFHRIEEIFARDRKKALIVEENHKHAQALAYYLESFGIISATTSDVREAIASLEKDEVNCVILDTGIADEKSYQAIEAVKKTSGMEHLPVIIFTGKNLSRPEEIRLKQYADSVIFKTAHSYQRILDEISLFLHVVEENKHSQQGISYRKLGGLEEVLRNKKALIADDDVRNIFSLTRVLESFGMILLTAMDGKEALQQLNEHPDVDIALIDMMMPEMDGYETIKHVRAIPGFSTLPIIAVTAKAMAGDREKCISSGASDYITKPIDTDQLLSLLRVWLYDVN